MLAEAIEAGLILEAVVAQNRREQAAFWRFRETLSEAVFAMHDTYGFDIGLPADALPSFLTETEDAMARVDPTARPWVFGHLGDGNLHYIVTTQAPEAVGRIVYDAVARKGGALSAEHGLGREKTAWLSLFRTPAEIATMRRLKAAFDPRHILNPGRVMPPEDAPA
ncbi:putative FAD-linked oxidoreductase [Roseisalinus antarcticus]|uniref:Putative FAD-linked oxidoreductase n=1 Tax=Roseisalinus antarcticus TaxID=254357 RepID=A0A1Y5TNP0_9RHOB|nr:putative FAD-linked oxidoreductase [Roseisalinus antarcticus]